MRHLTALLAVLLVVMGFEGLAQTYLLQPGDRIEVTVIEDPGLNRTLLVRPDGRVSMPLAGTVEAAGRTPEAVQSAIRNALSGSFVQPPTVSVSLASLGTPSPLAEEEEEAAAEVFVIGQVGEPGAYNVALPVDALQMLALAGGPSTFAASSRIQIRRRAEDGAETVFLFDYEALENGVVPSPPIMLQSGDVIVVPERRLFE